MQKLYRTKTKANANAERDKLIPPFTVPEQLYIRRTVIYELSWLTLHQVINA